MNVLILSAGRRVELIKAFKSARDALGFNGKVIAADISDTAPALYFADEKVIVKPIKDGGFIIDIIDVCKKYDIDLIVPTIDTELPILAANKALIEKETKAIVLISSPEVVAVCYDKHKTADFFAANNLSAPHTLTEDEIGDVPEFPLFIKPSSGSSSINAFVVNSKKELTFFKAYIDEHIVQQRLLGTEYTIDILCDFNSLPITIVPRIRLATRGGEVLKGQIAKNEFIVSECKRLIECLKPIGPITVQGFLTQAHQFYFVEINPRFGGGAPMSIKAGADSCANLYRLLSGETLSYNEDYQDGLIFSRFDDSIAVGKAL
ncbi:carbamoyl phosphate synthase [Synergistales bacterium]|nr:carbamoyl phosphate synthase [Synergistales bacterium]